MLCQAKETSRENEQSQLSQENEWKLMTCYWRIRKIKNQHLQKWKLSRKVDDDKNDGVASNGMTMVKTFGFCLTYACEIPVPIF